MGVSHELLTPEAKAWALENYATCEDFPSELERRFGISITRKQGYTWAHEHGCARRDYAGLPWRDHPEWDEFIREFVPGHSVKEVIAEFHARFGIVLTKSQVQGRKNLLGVKCGTKGGQFKRGWVAENKGRPWAEWMSEASQERSRRTCFKSNQLPHNTRPIGAERVSKDGYVEVHVAQHRKAKANDQWVAKHRLIWEEANGRKLGKGEIVVFADGDRRNFSPDNLVMVTQRQNVMLRHMGAAYTDAASLKTALLLADLRLAVSDRERAPRKCWACGATFKPEWKAQRTCRACLDKGIRKPRGKAVKHGQD